MSTWFTQRGVAMVESRSLALVFATADVHERIVSRAAQHLQEKGYQDLSPAVLEFLGTLDCGVNVASDVARALGVSRQMVGKTVTQLSRAGYLQQREATGRQKHIVFTDRGERMMADVRAFLAELDRELDDYLGTDTLARTLRALLAIDGLLAEEDTPQGRS